MSKETVSKSSSSTDSNVLETAIESIADSTEELTYQLIEKALSLPGVKINRRDFLVHALGDEVDVDDIPDLLRDGPLKSGLIARRKLNKIAVKLCDQNRLNSSIASFASGLPGGLALAATVPLDTLQFFAINLRSAQQVAYLYGYDDFWLCLVWLELHRSRNWFPANLPRR
ncbi:MAG: hypothetical protein CR966_01665 [Pseudomonadales bacterium]|nr:MAG: hypothetical protein CR966_01665 [Pseudomonadales bacterium]